MLLSLSRLVVIATSLVGLGIAAEPTEIWLDVPFVKQEKNACGTACIAMVMQYWIRQDGGLPSWKADADTIQQALYPKGAKGIFAADMERYFEETGFRAFVFRGEWIDLKQHLSKGRPLIVCLRESGRGGPLHYVVVAGMNWQGGLLLINDPAQRKLLRLDRASFERGWSATRNWTLLALPSQDK